MDAGQVPQKKCGHSCESVVISKLVDHERMSHPKLSQTDHTSISITTFIYSQQSCSITCGKLVLLALVKIQFFAAVAHM